MCGEEDIQQLGKADLRFIKINPDHFRMLGFAGAYLFIAGLLGAPAGIAADDFIYAFELQKNRFCAPEAAAAK